MTRPRNRLVRILAYLEPLGVLLLCAATALLCAMVALGIAWLTEAQP